MVGKRTWPTLPEIGDGYQRDAFSYRRTALRLVERDQWVAIVSSQCNVSGIVGGEVVVQGDSKRPIQQSFHRSAAQLQGTQHPQQALSIVAGHGVEPYLLPYDVGAFQQTELRDGQPISGSNLVEECLSVGRVLSCNQILHHSAGVYNTVRHSAIPVLA